MKRKRGNSIFEEDYKNFDKNLLIFLKLNNKLIDSRRYKKRIN